MQVLLPALFDQGAGVGGQAAASTVEALIFAPKGSSILGFPWRLLKTLWHARSFVGAIKAHNWAYLEPKLAKVVAYAKSKITDPSQSRLGTPADTSSSKLALLGFCWGGWFVPSPTSYAVCCLNCVFTYICVCVCVYIYACICIHMDI